MGEALRASVSRTATGGLCVKNFCQPRIGGKWCKTALSYPCLHGPPGNILWPRTESEA